MFRRSARKRRTALVGTLATLTLAAGVVGLVGTPGAPVATADAHVIWCTATAQAPNNIYGTTTAFGAVGCTGAPESLGIRVCLQRSSGGPYVQLTCNPTSGYSFKNASATNSKTVSRVGCAPGYWYRTVTYAASWHGNWTYPQSTSVGKRLC
ncbi:MAG: hypothetical protein QOE32_6506 [Pseudonocardiales bacterium]|jgi:hypothetical protein|nr:hypothetical protein [Pseudonocardiales bacterium]